MRKKSFFVVSGFFLLFVLALCLFSQKFFATIIAKTDSDAFNFAKYVLTACCFLFVILSYIILYKNLSVETNIFLLVFCFGLFYLLSITPLSACDEGHHYKSSYIMSNDILGSSYHPGQDFTYGYSQDFNEDDYVYHHNVASGYSRIVKTAFSKRNSEDVLIKIQGPYQYNYPIEYLFPTLGVCLARIMNLNSFWVYTFGRLSNLIAYSICVYIAVKRASKFKLLLGIIALLPMSLHQAASFSYDTIINGGSLILIASLIFSIFNDEKFRFSELLWILIPGLVIGPVKGIYALLAAAMLAIPKKRFKNSWAKFAIVIPSILIIFTFGAVGYLKWKTKAVGV